MRLKYLLLKVKNAMNHDDHKNPGKIFGSLKPTCKRGTLELTVHQITVSGASKNLT